MLRSTLLALSLFFCLQTANAQKLPALIPYADSNGLWGYANPKGEVVIQPQWRSVNFFRNGKAVVSVDDRSGYCIIDTSGNYIIPPNFHWRHQWAGWDKTDLNVYDDSGHYGLADTNGHLIIPMRYAAYYDYGPLRLLNTDNPWHKPAIVIKKDGKAGIIDTEGHVLLPFDYEVVSLTMFSYLNPDYIFVKKDGKVDIITASGKSILGRTFDALLADSANRNGFISIDNGKFGYIAYPSMKQLVPFKYAYLRFVDSFLIASIDGHYGIIDCNGHKLLPFEYSSISPEGNNLQVEKILSEPMDKNAVPNAGLISIKDGSAKSVVFYTRILDAHTLKPLTDWMVRPDPFHRQWECGYGHHMAAEERAYESMLPRVTLDGKAENVYNKDSMQWLVLRNETQLGNYSIVSGSKNNYNGSPQYQAIVDRNANYITPPLLYQLISYNAQDGLIVVSKDGKYGILDMQLHEVFPFQSKEIHYGFKWKSKLYALVFNCACPAGTPSGGIATNYMSFQEFEHRRDQLPRDEINKNNYRCVMNTDTQIVFDFKGYKIESMTDEYGKTNCKGNVYPCFWVRDTAGYMGVLSPLGKVLMHDIGFKYKAISGIGDGLFLGPNQLNPKSYAGQIYNYKNQIIFPQLTVNYMQQAEEHIYNSNGSGVSINNGSIIYGLYQVYYVTTSGKQGSFYMNKDGHAYTNVNLQ